MRPNRVRELWRSDERVRATWILTGDPMVTEILANTDIDALIIDMQHGFSIGPERANACLLAISTTDVIPFVRIPWNDPVHFQYALDAGAYGIIVPMVNSKEDAIQAIQACRYPPLGARSIGANRVEHYAGQGYFQHANQEVICLVMIEHIDAVGEIEDIAAVPGLDGFFIGPGDLALSLGLGPGDGASSARFLEACDHVAKAAKRHGLVAGIAPSGPQDARRWHERGFGFCPVGSDWSFLVDGVKDCFSAIDRT
jgi:4-hydroxy-2-oxoheptanedioate aldolase